MFQILAWEVTHSMFHPRLENELEFEKYSVKKMKRDSHDKEHEYELEQAMDTTQLQLH